MHFQLVVGDDELIEPQRGDTADLLDRAPRLGLGDIAQPRLEVAQHGIPGVTAHADDIGEAELVAIGVVDALERGVFCIRQPVEAGAVLLVCRFCSEPRCTLGLVGEIGMRPDQRELHVGLGALDRRHQRCVQLVDTGERPLPGKFLRNPR